MKHRLLAAAAATLAWTLAQPLDVRAQSASDFEALKKEVERLRRRDEENQRKMETLERKLDQLQKKPEAAPVAAPPPLPAPVVAPVAAPAPTPATPSSEAALDAALQQAQDQAPEQKPVSGGDFYSRRVGPATVRLIEVSMDTLLAVGGSTANNAEIAQLEGGAHDPKKQGFTLQQAELSFAGAVDPYLTGEAHIVATVEHVELEEAFMTTTSLPYSLQLELGYFLTEFGIINPLHPHAWAWVDQPVINTRMFGGEGLRSPGLRLGWLAPLPWYSEVDIGVQNADEGELTESFLSEEPIGGRPNVDDNVTGMQDLLYLARLRNAWDLTPNVNLSLGFSGLFGPNSTGDGARSFIYGTDIKLRWRPENNFRGWPFFVWQTEAMTRDYTADAYAPENLPSDILRDAGFYTQGLYGFTYGWAGGVRVEYADGRGDSVEDGMLVSHNQDPFRDQRIRVSPLLMWQPTEFSRFRLQYNFDNAKHLPGEDASSVWVTAEILYGMHPAHVY